MFTTFACVISLLVGWIILPQPIWAAKLRLWITTKIKAGWRKVFADPGGT